MKKTFCLTIFLVFAFSLTVSAQGLLGSLLVGLAAAKGLSLATGKPLIGVDHLHAHLLAATIGNVGGSAFNWWLGRHARRFGRQKPR